MKAPERILLDTCVVSQFTYRYPSPDLITWIRKFPEKSLAISVATVFEIQKGIEHLRACKSDRASQLESWLEDILASDIDCLLQDVCISRLLAKMVAVPKLKHLWIPDRSAKKPKLGQDLLIAATAIRYRLPLATTNSQDFLLIHEHFRLPGIFNPSTMSWCIPENSTNDDKNYHRTKPVDTG
ncbi:PIN domain-containing protein [Ochrobactrum chromiisoli]|uniref:PIN domain-containing protein n=1 Tax=Ochrobactrum chromiisoli TaxID=2993941 RepID=A0ABT3QSL6_9HYPH|nr:PIN domain-containing protein [Ochrobactrum chromiisoli]MCX2698596.1 hypothetical protein [Ochrobactrum chromiisoli]